METYSLSVGDKPVVKPNVALQSVNLNSLNTTRVLFSVKKGELFVLCTYDSREHSSINHE